MQCRLLLHGKVLFKLFMLYSEVQRDAEQRVEVFPFSG